MSAVDGFAAPSGKWERVQQSITQPASKAFAISPHNSNELPFITRGIYVGVGGDIVAILAEDSTAVTFKNAVAGTVIPVRAKIVQATNTTATNLLGLV